MKKSIILIPLPSLIKNLFVRSFSLSLLNKRLTQWVEGNSIINEAQAGFRRRKKLQYSRPYFYLTYISAEIAT